MTNEQTSQEARALWAAVFGTPPSHEAEAGDLLRQLVESLPEVGYQRLIRPGLSETGLVWPDRRL